MKFSKITAGLLACFYSILSLGFTASGAEAYAIGDVNGDTLVDAEDAALILVDAVAIGSEGMSTFTEAQFSAADVDGSGTHDATDAAAILVYSTAYGTGVTTDDFQTYLEKTAANLDSLATPQIIVGKLDLAAVVKWDPIAYASGYEIYRYDGSSAASQNYKLIATVTDANASRYMDTLSNNSDPHCYKICAFRNQPNGTLYSEFSNADVDYTTNSILNAADLEPHNTITVYNRQKAETTSYVYTLSDEDLAILEKFAVEHFPANATREEQLWTTLYWIHKEVDYAYAGELWNSISGMSWAEAVFENQLGQCVQYNGALASMMAYLGYDVCMIQGFRGTWPSNYWQHFWPEVTIAGKTYMMECGNYGKSGDWYYFLETYDQTTKYICNEKNMS